MCAYLAINLEKLRPNSYKYVCEETVHSDSNMGDNVNNLITEEPLELNGSEVAMSGP
jgi:hypothetical protein